MNKLPKADRPVQEKIVTTVSQYQPGGYAKGRCAAAARLGAAWLTPAWVVLQNLAKGAKAEGI
eukprot:2278299-Alexandrium_andersonii.AAC.1